MASAGDILGGLAQIGAGGAFGAYGGDIEGRVLKQNLESQQAENQLRMLRAMHEGQTLSQPRLTPIGGGRFLVQDPTTGQWRIGSAPPGPLSPLDQAKLDEQRALAELHRRQAGQVGQPHPAAPLDAKTTMALQAWQADPANQGKSVLEFFRAMRDIEHPPQARQPVLGSPEHPRLVEQVMISPVDGKPHRYQLRTVTDPKTFETTTRKIDLGLAEPRAHAGGLTPRETVTTTTKVTPRKEITNTDELNKVQSDLESVTNEIASNPRIYGWMQPGAFVRVEGYDKPVRREDVIARAMLQKHGAGVSVRWDGKNWRLVRAWIPEQREPVETRRTTGPPGRSQAQEPDEEE